MMEILFINIETGRVAFAITDISIIRYITPSEIGFTYANGRNGSCAFTHAEKLEVEHKKNSPMRAALMREVGVTP